MLHAQCHPTLCLCLPAPQVFNKHGVEQYNPDGDKFDPNLHQAMFEVPDASKEAGMIAVVTKVRRGWMALDRCDEACVHICPGLLVGVLMNVCCGCQHALSLSVTLKPAGNVAGAAPDTQHTPWALPPQRGYKMHDRILRAAEVGVYKAP